MLCSVKGKDDVVVCYTIVFSLWHECVFEFLFNSVSLCTMEVSWKINSDSRESKSLNWLSHSYCQLEKVYFSPQRLSLAFSFHSFSLADSVFIFWLFHLSVVSCIRDYRTRPILCIYIWSFLSLPLVKDVGLLHINTGI